MRIWRLGQCNDYHRGDRRVFKTPHGMLAELLFTYLLLFTLDKSEGGVTEPAASQRRPCRMVHRLTHHSIFVLHPHLQGIPSYRASTFNVM